jgi:hypothetical protein
LYIYTVLCFFNWKKWGLTGVRVVAMVRVLVLLKLPPGPHVHGLVASGAVLIDLVHPACHSQPLQLLHPLQFPDLVLVLQLLLHDVLGPQVSSVCCPPCLLLAFGHLGS